MNIQVDDSIGDHDEDATKDEYFKQVADIANNMIEQHGKDFAMGTFVLAARFIAEGKPLVGNNSVKETSH